MPVLSVQAAAKSYAGRDLFRDVSFDLDAGMRLAVVGPNGVGKSTLLKMVVGEIEPDTGRIFLGKGLKVGYAAQDLSGLDLAAPLLSWVLAVLPSWSGFWAEWEAAAGNPAKLQALAARQAELEAAFGYNPEHQAKAILHGLGFEDKHFERPLSQLSGGWRERAKLARVLLTGEDLLILDEPTNHLDLEAVGWLEDFLRCRGGALLLVVHDRVFLDNVATHVLFLGEERPVVRKGNFGDFLVWQEEREKTKERHAAKLAAEIERKKDYVRRFRAKARKASQAQSKLRQAERLQDELGQIVMEKRRRTLDFSLPAPARGDKVVAQAQELRFTFPGKAPLWSGGDGLSFHLYRGQKVALVGHNGAGKSTLLRLLVGELLPGGGSIGLSPQTKVGYFSQHRSDILSETNTVLAELRRLCDPKLTEETLMAALGLFLLGQDYFERPVGRLSGGEKARLSLASLFLSGSNLLVLDEPTNHLDMESREGLTEAIGAYEGTVLMVAHDRHLLAEAADQLWELGPGGLRVFESYADYALALAEASKPADSGCALTAKPRVDKDERRRRAEIRQRLGRELNPRKERYAALEARLETCMLRQDELEQTLADPATYARTEEFLRLTAEYQAVRKESEETMAEMERLEAEITELERERDTLLAGDE